MAQRRVTQSVATTLTAYLTLASSGAAATGLVAADLTCEISKNGGALAAYSLVGKLTEIGSGIYTVSFTAAALDTLGQFIFTLNGATISQFAGDAEVVGAASTATSASVLTCILSDHVFGLVGEPVHGAAVTARVLASPLIQGAVGISASTVGVTTDATGQFFLTLPRGAEVEVTIPAMGYTRRLTVPNAATSSLFAAA